MVHFREPVISLQQFEEFFFIDNGNVMLARLVQLAAGFSAGNDIISFCRNTPADPGPQRLQALFRLIPCHGIHGPGQGGGCQLTQAVVRVAELDP